MFLPRRDQALHQKQSVRVPTERSQNSSEPAPAQVFEESLHSRVSADHRELVLDGLRDGELGAEVLEAGDFPVEIEVRRRWRVLNRRLGDARDKARRRRRRRRKGKERGREREERLVEVERVEGEVTVRGFGFEGEEGTVVLLENRSR